MQTTEQKLREACNYIDVLGGDSRSYRQVLALPTAVPESLEALSRKLDTQTPDLEVSEMINGLTQAETDASAPVSGLTAAPVGERELPPLPSYARWEERIKTLMQQCGHPNSMSIYQAFKQFQNEFEHEMIAYARAALSAGDAVDAQRYRWLREQSDDDFAFAVVKTPHFDVYESPEELDSAIDAAIRKGQL